jgi:hypothetical protein
VCSLHCSCMSPSQEKQMNFLFASHARYPLGDHSDGLHQEDKSSHLHVSQCGELTGTRHSRADPSTFANTHSFDEATCAVSLPTRVGQLGAKWKDSLALRCIMGGIGHIRRVATFPCIELSWGMNGVSIVWSWSVASNSAELRTFYIIV